MKAKIITSSLAALRQRAEELMKKKLPKTTSQLSEADSLKIRHELEVHQIELELQQEELMWAEEQTAKVANERYAELCNFAPSGYFTLSKEGEIIELNLSGAKMLGKESSHLKNSLFGFFVSDNTKPIFNQFLVKAFNSEVKETCEVILSTNGNLPINVFLTGIAKGNVEQCYVSAIDNTERKRTENALLESEKKYRNIFENIQDVYYEATIDGIIVEVSPSICYMSKGQYMRDDLIGKSMCDFYYVTGGRQTVLALLQERGIVTDYEIFLKNRDGSQVQCSISAKIQFDTNGKPLKIIGNMHDITERKQAEKEITMLAHSLKSINECVSITDLNDKILFVNESFLKTYGYAENELIGKHISIVRSQNNVKELVEKILPATIHGEWQGELLNKRKDGSEFPIYLSTTIVKDKEGKTLGLIGVATDISERKQAKQLIKLLSRAIEQSPVTVMITDKKGNIEYVNPEFTELTGYKTDEVKGKNPRFLQSGLQTREFYKELWNTILSGKSWYGELLNKKKNGDLYWESALISSIVNNQGDITFFVAVMEDITEKKKMVEDLIQAKAKAEESDRLKTSFLNNISHEIRTPFNGILGFLSLIQDNNMSVSERDEYISIINKSAYRLMNTINDIVEISQIQAGQMKLIVSKTNIRELAGELYTRFITEAEIKGLKFFINKDLPNKVEWIYTDSIKLNAILSNLIGNAIKFTNTGSIVFGIRLVDKVDEHALSLQFSVKDTGVGISENKQQAIFERFMQADGSNTRLYEGSGLGLSIAKAYVEMLNGKIWIESEEGKGSIFYFTIPYKDKPEEKNDVKNIVMNDGTENQINTEVLRLKILIVEDNEESAILLSISVRSFGKEVIKVRNGFEAIEACRNNPDIDLVLMDIKMPDMDGYEATRQIRKFNKNVVIIAQTAYALIGDSEKAIESGCNDYIAKPFNRATLGVLIEKHFKKQEK